MRLNSICAVGAVLGALLAPSTLAMPFQAEATTPAEKYVERIEVYGKQTTAQLERVVFKAKVDFYEAFNAYNDDPQYHVVCRAVRQTGTNIKRKTCQANYVAQGWHRMTQMAFDNGLSPAKLPSRGDVEFALKKEHAAAQKKMVDVAMENPEVMDSLLNYLAVYESLEQKRDN